MAAPVDAKQENLEKATSHLLEECRMVLPGIQALFGFQWIAVFNQRFRDLTSSRQSLHLVAMFSIALAAAVVMTPAAYHRALGAKTVTDRFLRISTRLLLLSMFFLAVGIAMDFSIVATLILANPALCALLAVMLGVILLGLWFVFPRLQSR